MIGNVFKAEIKKYLAEVKCYYPDHIVSLVVTYIFFIAFFVGLPKTGLANEYLHIGFIFWFFSSVIISEGSVSISYEKQTGTFEQLLLKPAHILTIISCRSIVWILVTFVKVILLISAISITLKVLLPFNFMIIPVLVITIIGLFGFGLILSSLTLLFSKTASFETIISYFLLFFTGGIVPLDNFPEWMIKISELLPLTIGIKISQQILDNQATTLNEWTMLILNSSIYLIVGIAIFNYVYKYSKYKGLSSEY